MAKTGTPVKRKEDVTVRLIAIFKQLLAEGVIAPGGRLPAERELAESFGVSRSSLRQALKVLEIMGVISQRVGDGTYVNSGAGSILRESMEFLILLDGKSFHEVMEARLIVEPELAARAAERSSAEDISRIRGELTAMEKAGTDHGQFVEHDILFHNAIFEAAGNRVCSLMFSVVHRSLDKLVTMTSYMVKPDHTIQLHRRIFDAIRRGDAAEARRRMLEHLMDAKDLLMTAAEQQGHSKLQERIHSLRGGKHNGSGSAGRAI
jgi:GntR family transcriptional repressor for pyruvate dehydrogenase complex